jgi:hypothetical protein
MRTFNPFDSESVEENDDTVDSVNEGGCETVTLSLECVRRHMMVRQCCKSVKKKYG